MKKKEAVYRQEEEREAEDEYEDSQNLAVEQVSDDASKDELRDGMELGDSEEDVYSDVGRDKLLEDDEIDPWEEGFLEGAEQKGELSVCAHCGSVLDEDKSQLFEKKFRGEIMWFCSERCAKSGPKKVLSK